MNRRPRSGITPAGSDAWALRFGRRLVAVLLFGAVISWLSGAEPARTIRVVMDDNYPPYIFKDAGGELQGILVDQWRLWERKTGIAVELHAMDWGEALRRMRAGEFDVIDTIFHTPERDALYDFTPPYARIDVPIFFHEEISGITDAASLKGFPVAAKEGDAAVDVLRARGIDTLLLFKNYESIVEAAQRRQVNVFVIDAPPALYYLHKLDLQENFRRSAPISNGEFHRAVGKGRGELLRTVEAGFAAITPDELAGIDEKWLGATLGSGRAWRWVVYVAVGGACLIAILLGWNRTLRHEVNRRTRDVTRSELRLRALLDHIPDWVWFKDPDSRYVTGNASYARAVGRTPEALPGRVDADFWPTDDARKFATDDRAVLASGGPLRLFEKIRDRDGRDCWIETVKAVVRDANGAITGTVGIARDVTERLQADAFAAGQRQVLEMIVRGEPLTATLETLLRVVEAQSPDMLCSILLLDAEGRRVCHCAAPSLPREFMQSIDGLEIGPSAGSCGTAAYRREPVFVADIEHDPLWQNYKTLALPHGLRACWSTPVLDADDKVLGTFAIYYRQTGLPDQRHRQLIEVATHTAAICLIRHRSEEALREGEERFRQVVENILEVFWMTDVAKSRMLYVSPNYEKIWGRSCESLYQNAAGWIESVVPEDRPRVLAMLDRQITGEYDIEYRITRPDGATRWIHDRAFPVRDADGEVYRVVGLAEDITEWRRLEEQLRQAQKMEAIGQLSGGVAHDFNNILTVIQGNASLLELESQLSESVRENLQEIKGAAARAADLTRQLLMFSRRQAMRPRAVDLNEVVTGMSRMLMRLLGAPVRMELRLSAQPVMVFADSGMLEQIVVNLAVNARDAMPRGGTLTIATRTLDLAAGATGRGPQTRAGAFAVLAVSDNGEGIPAEILPRIFEPFFTTKSVRDGTGLGLATVYGIVEQHEGWIEVDSEVGRGTTFRIHVPRINASAAEKIATTDAAPTPSGTETILVVEDEPALRLLVRNLLRRLGHTILEASTGPEALELWREHRADVSLLVTDLVMPDGMSGFDLAEQLRRDRPELRVIYTSGYSPEIAGRHQDLHEGVNFLAKPFDVERLTSAVRAALDRGPAKAS